MRILEIIEPIEKLINVPVSWDISKLRSDISKLPLKPGEGSISKSYSTKDPNIYGKKSRIPVNLENEGFYQYIQAVKSIMSVNPYVPEVYKITLVKDKQGLTAFDYKMETLVRGQTLDKKTIYELGVKTFNNKNWFKALGNIESYQDLDNIELWKILTKLVELAIHAYPKKIPMTMFPIDVDQNLTDLAKILRRIIISKNNLEIDLHDENIMVRPGKLELVINDPIDTY